MPPRLSTVTIERFRGLQTTLRRNQTGPGQATLLRNLTVRDGTLRKLPGQSLWGTCTGSTKPCRWFGLHRRTDGGMTALAYAGDDTNGHLYYKKDPTGTAAQALAALAGDLALDSHAVEGVQLHRMTYLVDGEALWVFNGETDTLTQFEALGTPTARQGPTLTEKVALQIAECNHPMGWTAAIMPDSTHPGVSTVVAGYPTTVGAARFPWLDDPQKVLYWSVVPDVLTPAQSVKAHLYFELAEQTNFVTTFPTESINFLLYFDTVGSSFSTWQSILNDGSTSTYLKLALYNGTPGAVGTKKVLLPISNVAADKWIVASAHRADAEALAVVGDDPDPDFWKHIKAVGLEASCSFINTGPTELHVYLGEVTAPGLLADQVQPLEVGFTLYNEATGVESGLSPTEQAHLFPDDPDTAERVYATRSVCRFGVLNVEIPDVAFGPPTPTHIRVYASLDGEAWYRIANQAYVQGTNFDINVDLLLQETDDPHEASTADIVPTHLATWTHASRLVALGCLYDEDNDGVKESHPERLWVSDWIDPLTGTELYWPPASYAGPGALTDDAESNADNGIYFDVAGAGEFLAGREFGGWIWCFARGGVWVLQGLDARDWQCIQVNQAVGCQSAGSVVEVLGGILYLGTDNVVYRLDGGLSPQPVGVGEDGVCPIKGLLDGLSDEHLQESVGLFADGYYLLSFPPECSVAGIAYDTLSGAWLELAGRAFSRGHRGAPNLSDPDQNQQMALAGDLEPAATDTPKGRVLRMLTPGTYSDFGEPLEARWRSGLIPLAEGGGRVHGAVLRLRVTASPEAPIDLTVTGDTGDEVHFAQRSTSSEEPETLRTRTPSRWTRGMQVEVAQTSTADLVVEELALQPMGWRKDL
jgi:hypothetical protein